MSRTSHEKDISTTDVHEDKHNNKTKPKKDPRNSLSSYEQFSNTIQNDKAKIPLQDMKKHTYIALIRYL